MSPYEGFWADGRFRASMERQVFLAPPWHLVEPVDGKVSLGPRGARVLKVAFRPELMGETSYFLSFSRSKEGTTKLVGKGGDPFTLVTEETWRDARSIERFIGMSIEWKKVEGFNYTYSGIFDGGGMTQVAPEKPKSRLMRGGRR